jgi:hypothetical protein
MFSPSLLQRGGSKVRKKVPACGFRTCTKGQDKKGHAKAAVMQKQKRGLFGVAEEVKFAQTVSIETIK